MKNTVQTQTTTDNSTATVNVTESKTKLADVPTQSQAFISSVAKEFHYDIELMDSEKEYLPCFYYASTSQKQTSFIQEKIRQLTSTGTTPYGEIGILCQNPARLTTLANALNKAKIPFVETYHSVGDYAFRMMKDVLEILDWIANNYYRYHYYQQHYVPVNAITQIVTTLNKSECFSKSLIEKISQNGWMKFKTSDSTKDIVTNFRNVAIHLAKQTPVTQANLTLLTQSVLPLLKLKHSDKKSSRVIERDLKLIVDSLAEYSDWKTMIQNFPTFTTQGVELTTYEDGNNKKWEHVLVLNVVKGLLPRNNLPMSDEREWFFNAITCHTKSVVVVQNPAAQTAIEKEVQLENPSSYFMTGDGIQYESTDENILLVTGDKYH
jgi:superfamily I DNA/RNA helicase